MKSIEDRLHLLLQEDPYLKPFEEQLRSRLVRIEKTEERLTLGKKSLSEFAAGHEYFGLHYRNSEWVFREWAPNATKIFLIGDMTDWREQAQYALSRIDTSGVWELRLSSDRMQHGDLFRLRMHWPGGEGDRIPAYARRVVQDPETLIFNSQVWLPVDPYRWKSEGGRKRPATPLIYEAHIGMAQEEAKIGTYREFTLGVLPRIKAAGYNTLQIMAIQEHPYYGSFGYQVSNFFAPSSRFGTPEDLKALVDTAHAEGLYVIMDIIHSHAVSNEVEGLSRFDGTLYQYFHSGPRGRHTAWDSRCFDYGKIEVLHFLLSNCRYWMDAYRFDGFRFDGITSMLYHHHGLGMAFTRYDDYFDNSVDEDALTYLALANRLIHEVNPEAITIAEDVSGMPGLAASPSRGGFGFDFRFAMGVPDTWIRLIKEIKEEDWPIGYLWFELTNRRKEEKTISYAESHDQALVGDQSIIFRLIGSAMYDHMRIDDGDLRVERGIALHKMIRLITLATAGHGYLNFMGNEFGHPEWIDFPREGNNWSYAHARRQWHLVDDTQLKYHLLARFDRDMIRLVIAHDLLGTSKLRLLHEHTQDKVIVFERGGLIFAFNFHPTHSHFDYGVGTEAGKFRMILNSDDGSYGGHGRLVPDQVHFTRPAEAGNHHILSLYLPTRTAIVLQREME